MRTAKVGFVGLDFDNVRDPDSGEVSELGAEVLRRFAGTYVEISPSHTGLRVFCLGESGGECYNEKHPGGKEFGGIEMYPGGAKNANYMRVTGALVTGCAGVVSECQAGIDWAAQVVAGWKAAKGEAKAVTPTNGGSVGGVVGSVAGGEAANDPAIGGDVAVVATTSASIEAKVGAMRIEAVEEALFKAWDPEADETKHPAVVVDALRNMAKPGKPLGQRLAKFREGKENSEDDFFLCCAAVRGGALTVADAAEVLRTLAPRSKVATRGTYRNDTAEQALKKVLVQVLAYPAGLEVDGQKVDGRSFRGWAFLKEGGGGGAPSASTWTLPGGLADALNKSGDALALDKTGRPLATDPNVVVILRNDPTVAGLLGFDELQQRAVRTGGWGVLDRGAADQAGPITDDDAVRLGMWLQRAQGMRTRHGDLMRCIEAAARDRRFNPLAQRLDELAASWDGVPRVDGWLTKYAKAEAKGCAEYVAAAGRCFMVSAVARALQPGCKVDTVLALEGAGGGGKSSLFQALADAAMPGVFADGVHDASNTVALVEGTGGRWIVELAELAGIRKAADVEALKASITRSVDTFRRPYEVKERDYPRRFVFVATTNKSQYLADPTGALLRRFMPVKSNTNEVNRVDLEGLKRDAGQLWGEAVHLYRAGVPWWIDAADGAAFTQWQGLRELRKEDSAFNDEVVAYLKQQVQQGEVKPATLRAIAGSAAVGDERAAAGDQAAMNRLAETLRANGMESKKSGGVKVWRLTPEGAARIAAMLDEDRAEAKAAEAADLCH
jgi:predicted P-loop ATPase